MKKILKIIITILTILLSILLMVELFQLDLLPMKYLIFMIIGVIIVLSLGIILSTRKKHIIRIIGVLLLILLLGCTIFGLYHVHNINDFLENSFKVVKTEKIKYYVIARAENKYKKKDISGEIGYYEESINVSEAINLLKKTYSVEELNFNELNSLMDQLDHQELKFVLIEKTNFNIIMELDENRKEEDYQIITELSISKKLKQNSSNREDSFNIYVGGTDYVGLMDFNTIITVNTKTHTVLLTSIPRDYYVDVVGYDYKNKLSFITEGIDVSKESIANLFGINIDYYIKIDSDSVVKLIDEIGGIEYCSDYAYNGAYNIYSNGYRKTVSYSIRKGCQHLDGYEAIAASRTRNAFNGRDRVRQQNMQKIIVAILKKLATKETLANYEEILNALSNSYETDIPKKIITNSVKDIMNNGNRWTIEIQSVDGEDGHDTVHRFGSLTDWVMYPNEDTVHAATEKINRNLEAKNS